MSSYEMYTAEGLCSCAFVGALYTIITAYHVEQPIKLTVNDSERDPFNIAKPEDLVDGYPIDPDRFWKRVKLWKCILALFLFLLLDARVGLLIYTTIVNTPTHRELIVQNLHIIFASYVFALSVFAVQQDTVPKHWPRVVQISALTGLASSACLIFAVLPADVHDRSNITDTFQTISLILVFLSFLIASTIPRGPPLHYPPSQLYSSKTPSSSSAPQNNVCTITQSSIFHFILFSHTTPVVKLGYKASTESLEIEDLPIVPVGMRAGFLFSITRAAALSARSRAEGTDWWWRPKNGSGWSLLLRLINLNKAGVTTLIIFAPITGVLYYAPPFFLRSLVEYLQEHPGREDTSWGWYYCAGLFFSSSLSYIVAGHMWSISRVNVQVALKVQLNTILFAKTLLRKTLSSTPASSDGKVEEESKEGSSNVQVMTLMTTDADRVSAFSWYIFTAISAPVEIITATLLLYTMLGVSCLFGLAVTCLFLPINHYVSNTVVLSQDGIMKTRDERVTLMNELLGAIRMLKFMAWERNFEKRVLKIRGQELKFQNKNNLLEVFMTAYWYAAPILVTVVSFWHFTVIRGQHLSPAIAFTSLSVFTELRFALSVLPETFINILQAFVSLRRIEKYLSSPEISPPLASTNTNKIVMRNATLTWPQELSLSESTAADSTTPSSMSTPKLARRFVLHDFSLDLPEGELTLVCGKLGSGKTLLLLSLLGETDLLSGQIISPRSPLDALASFSALSSIPENEWIVTGICAYVPQSAWLQNASIKNNILFGLPLDEKRYQQTLEACALISDLAIIEDGDEAEIGEAGVNLSGGQKARVSLARAIYSRASLLLLDDILSAVDAHTARHIYDNCIKGPLLSGRTVILVSHHVHLCVPGAKYVVALNNGRLEYAGDRNGFISSGIYVGLANTVDEAYVALTIAKSSNESESGVALLPTDGVPSTTPSLTILNSEVAEPKVPRKYVEDERRAVGRVEWAIWLSYFDACGGWVFWSTFLFAVVIGSFIPVAENGWIRYWSAAADAGDHPLRYVGIYAGVTLAGVGIVCMRWYVLYKGSIRASAVLYQKLLQAVLFANIRFHDTMSRGRLLNRFGKDFETIDSSHAGNVGRTLFHLTGIITTFITITVIGGPYFLLAAFALGFVYWTVGKVYSQTSRDLRRLDSVTRSPLYTMYGETVGGVSVLRAFGASTKFLRDMQRHVDTNTNPFYWTWNTNQWLGVRFNLVSCAAVGITGVVVLLNKSVTAAAAGFALTFAGSLAFDMLAFVHRITGLEQSMVAMERIQEFSNLPQEPAEYIEPRPPANWPHAGQIVVSDLVVRYAPELPNVLHNLSFSVKAGSKIGVLGRTGGGKSTLALSFFRFVEATEGKILIDGTDIAKIGLKDLRSRLTIIPQEPTVLSSSLRSNLDVFDEYEDLQIFEALRRVHLVPPMETPEEVLDTMNANVFRDLESHVENCSAGEKQLICMARAILKKAKVLILDEASASVDLATDELISQTIRTEFAQSTILTIAHRLRTVIDYDKVMILDQGRVVEFDQPHLLLGDPSSRFYGLCHATGPTEFAELQKLAAGAAQGAKQQEELHSSPSVVI